MATARSVLISPARAPPGGPRHRSGSCLQAAVQACRPQRLGQQQLTGLGDDFGAVTGHHDLGWRALGRIGLVESPVRTSCKALSACSLAQKVLFSSHDRAGTPSDESPWPKAGAVAEVAEGVAEGVGERLGGLVPGDCSRVTRMTVTMAMALRCAWWSVRRVRWRMTGERCFDGPQVVQPAGRSAGVDEDPDEGLDAVGRGLTCR